jgi:hypothetical protein
MLWIPVRAECVNVLAFELSVFYFFRLLICIVSHINPLKTEFLLNNIQDSVRTSQETHVSATKPNQLMMYV